AALALAHAGVFAWYQRPDWDTQWTDQEGYRRLGRALADTGRFTRYPEAHPFVPEVLRTPGYPAMLAIVYRTLGESHAAVAAAQSLLFVAICLMVMAIVAPLAGAEAAFIAGLVTAAYSPFPYFGALVLTELPTACLLTLACWRTLAAMRIDTLRNFAIAGAAYALVALTRPGFVLLPVAGAGCAWLCWVHARPAALARWAVLLVAFAVVLAPWLTYNYVYLHRLTMSPAGGVGRAMWEGSWHGVWSGRT